MRTTGRWTPDLVPFVAREVRDEARALPQLGPFAVHRLRSLADRFLLIGAFDDLGWRGNIAIRAKRTNTILRHLAPPI